MRRVRAGAVLDLESLRIGIIVRSFPVDRLNLQPWRYLTDLGRALQAAGHDVRFIVGVPGLDTWQGVPVTFHESVRDFEDAERLGTIAAAHGLDGGISRLTANLFSSMEERALDRGNEARLVGVLLRSLPTGPDLLRRFLDPVLVPEIGMDLHHLALFLSRQRGAWRLAPRYFRNVVFLWAADAALGASAGIPAACMRTLSVPFDPFWLNRESRGGPGLLERLPPSDRRVVYAGPPEDSRGVREVLHLPRALPRAPPTQVVALLREAVPGGPEMTIRPIGPHTLVVVRGMVPREEIREIYRASQAGLFPYRWVRTGFPLVIPEAVAAGLPVVTTRVHPFRDLEGHAGLVFADRGDLRGISASVDRVLSGADRDGIRRANDAWIRESPGWPEVARRYVDAMGA